MRRPHFVRAEGGSVSIITGLSLVALIGFLGLSVDIGSVYLETRRLQGTADLAAIAAAQNPNDGPALAQATVAANNWPAATRVEAVRGVYTPDRAASPASRFRPVGIGVNAVRVDVTASTPLFFARLFVPSGQMTIRRQATAAQTRMASFQIGSRLAALNGGIANDVLSALTGSSVSLSVMDYNALLHADVDLLSYTEALRTRLNLTAATYDQTLQRQIDAPVALGAIADVLAHDRNSAAASAMQALASASNRAAPVRSLDQLIDLGPYANVDSTQHDGATSIRVNALDLANAVLQLAGGSRQVRLQLGATLPGLAATQAWLAIGERPNHSPWLSVTDDRDVIIRTAQMRLYVETSVRPGGALTSLGAVRVPVLTELASAQARLSDIRCGIDPHDRQVTLSVSPSIGSLTLGDINTGQLDNFTTPLNPAAARMVNLGLIRIDGSAHVTLGGEQWQSVRFSDGDIANGTTKTVSTRDAAQATLSSLLRQTHLTIRAGSLGLGTQALTSGVLSSLSTLGAPLDQLLNAVSDLAGLHLGQADVRVNGVRCGGANLVG